jgi:hypothetical protein
MKSYLKNGKHKFLFIKFDFLLLNITMYREKLPLYFRETEIDIPFTKYHYRDLSNVIESIKLILDRFKSTKKNYIRSLKNICAHNITKFGITINVGQIPSELHDYVIRHRIKHRKIFPTFLHKAYKLGNWKIGKSFDFTCDYYRYYIIDTDEEENITRYLSLSDDIVKQLVLYNTKFESNPSKYNLNLRLCPHIDTPILNTHNQ